MNALERLTQYFAKFPGVGERQARRFANHLMSQPREVLGELGRAITEIHEHIGECPSCFRFFSKNGFDTCDTCRDERRNTEVLMVVEGDTDITSVERSGVYDGLYFVLGGTIPLLGEKEIAKLRGGALKGIVDKRASEGLKEVILAFSVNPDGENTARYVESLLADIAREKNLTISILGRGLSTGSELEYADPETIKSAFQNRH